MLAARNLLVALAAALALLVAPAIAQAATITVNTGGDGVIGCTLRNAINSADLNADQPGCTATNLPYGNDTVVVPASIPSPIQLGTEIDTGGMGTLTVQGPGVNSLDVRGGAGFRIFHVVNTVTITGLKISNGNQTGVSGEGGGVRVDGTGNLILDDVAVTNNTVTASGMNTNPGADGGGIYAVGPLTIRSSTVSNNSATATLTAGGAGNFSAATGAGVFVTGNSNLEIDRSTISGNIATATAPGGTAGSFANAGGLQVGNGSVNNSLVRRSTISGNQLSASNPALGGGAVLNAGAGGAGTNTLQSSTVTGNTGASAANLSGDEITVQNTLVSNPGGGFGPNCGNFSDVSSGGFNMEGGTNTCGFNTATDQTSVAATGLDPTLANNGGPTMTHALIATSPAIDTGNSFAETVDQRGPGFVRPFNFSGLANAMGGDGADIGAFEVQPACAEQATTPTTSCPTPTPTPPATLPVTPLATNPPPPVKKCKKGQKLKKGKCVKKRKRKK